MLEHNIMYYLHVQAACRTYIQDAAVVLYISKVPTIHTMNGTSMTHKTVYSIKIVKTDMT